MARLEGKIALVTGGGRGIGFAIGRRFSEEGALVIVNDLDGETAQKAATEAAVGEAADVEATTEAAAARAEAEATTEAAPPTSEAPTEAPTESES